MDGSNIGRLIKKLTPLLEEAVDPELPTYLVTARKSRRKIKTWDEFVLHFPILPRSSLMQPSSEEPVQSGNGNSDGCTQEKKHAHTIKTQVAVSRAGRFLDISRSYPGRIHDKTILESEWTMDKLPDKTKNG